MRIDIIEKRSNKRRIQIVLYDGLIDGENNCEVVFWGGTSKASSFIHLDLQEFYNLIHFIEMLPNNSFLCVGEDRFEARTQWRDAGIGDGTSIGYITFTLYDVKKEWGYSQVEFVYSELSWQLSQEKEAIKDNNVGTSDIVSNTELRNSAHFIDNELILHLSLNENDKDDYYYYGHICIETLFLKMERDLFVDISEAQKLRYNVPLLFEKGNPVNFCPLGEMIDITFYIKDDVIHVDGEISDLADFPTTDYVFHAIMQPNVLRNLQ